jgi:hypothetical protein
VAVVGKHPRARSLQTLRRDERVVDADTELGLRHAVRPYDTRHVDGSPRPEAEVDHAGLDDLLLPQQSGLDFDLAAQPERVDALIAGVLLRTRRERLPVVAARALAKPAGCHTGRDADQIEGAIAVGVAHHPDLAVHGGSQCRQRIGLPRQPDA